MRSNQGPSSRKGCAILKHLKRRFALLIHYNRFPVENKRVGFDSRSSRSDFGKLFGEVVPTPGIKPDLFTVFDRFKPVPVQLQFVFPLWTFW